jgi:hypothetical protein
MYEWKVGSDSSWKKVIHSINNIKGYMMWLVGTDIEIQYECPVDLYDCLTSGNAGMSKKKLMRSSLWDNTLKV